MHDFPASNRCTKTRETHFSAPKTAAGSCSSHRSDLDSTNRARYEFNFTYNAEELNPQFCLVTLCFLFFLSFPLTLFYTETSAVVYPSAFPSRSSARGYTRAARIRVIYCVPLRPIGKGNCTGVRLINFNEGRNQCIASAMRHRRRWRQKRGSRGDVDRSKIDELRASGWPRAGPPRYNNSICQSHPSRSNRFNPLAPEDRRRERERKRKG